MVWLDQCIRSLIERVLEIEKAKSTSPLYLPHRTTRTTHFHSAATTSSPDPPHTPNSNNHGCPISRDAQAHRYGVCGGLQPLWKLLLLGGEG